MILISHVKPNLAKSLYPMDDHQFVGYITKLTANNSGWQPGKTFETMGVSHCGLAIYIKKICILKAKEEELWKLKYFTMQK
jgi:hypothetical protein